MSEEVKRCVHVDCGYEEEGVFGVDRRDSSFLVSIKWMPLYASSSSRHGPVMESVGSAGTWENQSSKATGT